MTTQPVYFCKLEYLTADGWVVGHHGVNLLYPERYVERLTARGKWARCTIVETGEVFESPNTPDPATICVICGTIDHPSGACLL
jgi:hypothetical protein